MLRRLWSLLLGHRIGEVRHAFIPSADDTKMRITSSRWDGFRWELQREEVLVTRVLARSEEP